MGFYREVHGDYISVRRGLYKYLDVYIYIYTCTFHSYFHKPYKLLAKLQESGVQVGAKACSSSIGI